MPTGSCLSGSDVGLDPVVQGSAGVESFDDKLSYGGAVAQRSTRQPSMRAHRLLPQQVDPRMIFRISARRCLERFGHAMTDVDAALIKVIEDALQLLTDLVV